MFDFISPKSQITLIEITGKFYLSGMSFSGWNYLTLFDQEHNFYGKFIKMKRENHWQNACVDFNK